jgi:hypothetical protein
MSDETAEVAVSDTKSTPPEGASKSKTKAAPKVDPRTQFQAGTVTVTMDNTHFYKVQFRHCGDVRMPQLAFDLIHNGTALRCRYGVPVVLSGAMLGTARHSYLPHYSREGGDHSETEVTHTPSLPFEVLGEATRAEFNKLKRAGTKALKEQVEEIKRGQQAKD